MLFFLVIFNCLNHRNLFHTILILLCLKLICVLLDLDRLDLNHFDLNRLDLNHLYLFIVHCRYIILQLNLSFRYIPFLSCLFVVSFGFTYYIKLVYVCVKNFNLYLTTYILQLISKIFYPIFTAQL